MFLETNKRKVIKIMIINIFLKNKREVKNNKAIILKVTITLILRKVIIDKLKSKSYIILSRYSSYIIIVSWSLFKRKRIRIKYYS